METQFDPALTKLDDGLKVRAEGESIILFRGEWFAASFSRKALSELLKFAVTARFLAVPLHDQPSIDPWEEAASAEGWYGIYGGVKHPIESRTYDNWQECCIGESIKVPKDSGEKTVLAVLSDVAKTEASE